MIRIGRRPLFCYVVVLLYLSFYSPFYLFCLFSVFVFQFTMVQHLLSILGYFCQEKKNWWMGEKDVIGHVTQMHYFVGGQTNELRTDTVKCCAFYAQRNMELDVPVSFPHFSSFFLSLILIFFYWKLRCKSRDWLQCWFLLIFFSFFCLSLTSFVITHAQNTVPPNRLFWTPILSIWWATEGHHTHTKSKVRLKSSDDIPSLDRWIVLFVIFLLFVIDQGEMWHEWNRQNTKGFFFIDTSTLKEKKKERQRRIKETNRFVPRTPRHIVRS